MLENTIKAHPLLLKLSKSKDLPLANLLEKINLQKHPTAKLYYINKVELEALFYHLCELGNFRAIRIFLEFDYSELQELDDTHPFFLDDEEEPIDDVCVIVKGISSVGSYSDEGSTQQKIKEYLLKKYKQEIADFIFDDESVFSQTKSQLLLAMSDVSPDVVYSALQHHLVNKKENALQQHDSDDDDDDEDSKECIVRTLFEIATHAAYFEFAATQLLSLAAQEVHEAGDYSFVSSDFNACYFFRDLFYSSGAKTKVTLVDRQRYLETSIQHAVGEGDYFKLVVLIKTLGRAANITEMGEDLGLEEAEDTHTYCQQYTRYAIDALFHFIAPGYDIYEKMLVKGLAKVTLHDLDDKIFDNTPEVRARHAKDPKQKIKIWDLGGRDNLDSLAEEELEGLLEHQVFLSNYSDVGQNVSSIYRHLSSRSVQRRTRFSNESLQHYTTELQGFIQSSKEGRAPFDTSSLEHRHAQLESFSAPGEFITQNFSLYLHAKNPVKTCLIDVDTDEKSATDLHERQSLAERLIFSGTTHLHDIQRGYPHFTYVITNFGMVISDKPHQKKGNHQRLFKSVPIKTNGLTITGTQHTQSGHAEEAFYDYLLTEPHLSETLSQFKKVASITQSGHKVYAVVLDLHSTYDMCMACSKKTHDFQETFRNKILKTLSIHGFKTPTKHPTTLQVVIRYSADLHYHYPRTEEDTKKGLLTTIKAKGNKCDLEENNPFMSRNIRNYGSNLIIHGNDKWHKFWDNKKEKYDGTPPLRLEAWTAFTTSKRHRSLSNQACKTPYTDDRGYVNTNKRKTPSTATSLSLGFIASPDSQKRSKPLEAMSDTVSFKPKQ